ncbi:terminase TerL endonuclease subunit [Methylobacterium sp. B1]|uniref:terminase large subunit n=1 Tax=Methylobacterium sp. B1 TaxID=91459 RepID=UPI00034B39EF|nr:terminase TerL endonuclease subunit [Methylobacterium sp. B1]
MQAFPDYVGMAVWYCEEVASGRVPACDEERQGCQRFLDMRAHALTGKADFVWSDAHVIDVCDFVSKLPHVKAFAGLIVLEPVQCWYLAGIFGFREKATGLRWVRTVRVWIPRKNAKTTLSAGVVLYCANFEGEEGADVVVSAASEDQARIPYDVIRKMLGKDEDLREMTGAVDIKDGCEFTASGGTIKLAHARAKNLDGFNPHVLLQEELHAQDQGVIGVLKTAQGSRQAPLDLGISTAGRDVNAPAYDDWKVCRQVLAGRLNAPRMFIAMYAGSEADKDLCFDPATVEKLNPMWGISLNPTSIEEEAFEGRKSESKRQEYLRTRINFWSRAAGNLVSLESWERCADPKLKLEVLKGFPLYVGIDLASRSDLNAAAYMVKAGDRVYATADYWLPAKCERLQDDRFADAFLAWHRQNWLRLTPGTFIDYRVILRQILGTLDGHNVVGVGLDDYQANLMASEIEAAGYQVFIIQKNARNLTAATEDLVARTTDPELFQHDGNPITAWCAGNVVGHYDQNANVLPKKEKPWSKANIDGFDALVEANALRLDHEAGQLGASAKKPAEINPYLTRGLAGASA